MLMAISLAEKLGPKHGLTAFSLHPGVISTSLGAHLDFSIEMTELGKFLSATNCIYGI